MRNLPVESKVALSKMDELFMVHGGTKYWHWNFIKKNYISGKSGELFSLA